MFLQPVFYALRPLVTNPKLPGKWEFINAAVIIAADAAVYHYCGVSGAMIILQLVRSSPSRTFGSGLATFGSGLATFGSGLATTRISLVDSNALAEDGAPSDWQRTAHPLIVR